MLLLNAFDLAYCRVESPHGSPVQINLRTNSIPKFWTPFSVITNYGFILGGLLHILRVSTSIPAPFLLKAGIMWITHHLGPPFIMIILILLSAYIRIFHLHWCPLTVGSTLQRRLHGSHTRSRLNHMHHHMCLHPIQPLNHQQCICMTQPLHHPLYL